MSVPQLSRLRCVSCEKQIPGFARLDAQQHFQQAAKLAPNRTSLARLCRRLSKLHLGQPHSAERKSNFAKLTIAQRRASPASRWGRIAGWLQAQSKRRAIVRLAIQLLGGFRLPSQDRRGPQ